MAIRERLTSKSSNDDSHIRFMLRLAIEEQKRIIREAEEFGDDEVRMRIEHVRLTWLEGHLRTDAKLSLVRS